MYKMYQNLLKKKKKQSKKQHYFYCYPVVVKYLFCLLWLFMMQPTMASLRAQNIDWDTWESKDNEVGTMQGKIYKKNERLLTIIHSYIKELAPKELKYTCIRDDCTSSKDDEIEEIQKGAQIHLTGDIGFIISCSPDPVKVCTINLASLELNERYPLVEYNYNTKAHKNFLIQSTDELTTHISESIKNSNINTLQKDLKDKKLNLEDAKKNLSSLRQDLSNEKSNSEDAKKNFTRLIYFLIALLMICGFHIIYLHVVSDTQISAENANDEQNILDADEKTPVQSEDTAATDSSESEETKKKESAKNSAEEPGLSENENDLLDLSNFELSSHNYTPILVRDSYYEENCTHSLQITEEVLNKETTKSNELKTNQKTKISQPTKKTKKETKKIQNLK